MTASWQLWRDRRGRLSPLRAGTLALLLLPFAKALFQANEIAHGARPLNELIERARAVRNFVCLKERLGERQRQQCKRAGAQRRQPAATIAPKLPRSRHRARVIAVDSKHSPRLSFDFISAIHQTHSCHIAAHNLHI